MGVGFQGRPSGGCSYKTNPLNPNPLLFFIEKQENIGFYWITLVHYIGCKNYEGRKILVTTKEIPENTGFLDPHFIENHEFGLIARFVPTETGWSAAKILANSLTIKDTNG